MRCHECHRNIAAGVEAQKMVVEYLQPDGTTRLHGFGMPDGPISTARGQMITGRHSKAQPLDEVVLTPSGWKQMGDLRVGSSVISPGSSDSEVTAIYPRGRQEVYRVTMLDGSTARASADHLWQLADGSVIPTSALRGASGTASVLRSLGAIDIGPDPEIGPYLLGAILGDGGLRGVSPTLTTMDEEVGKQAEAELPANIFASVSPISGSVFAKSWRFSTVFPPRRGTNTLTARLRELGLWGLHSEERFIPPAAMFASYKYRLRLLHGLMDTDGTVSKAGQVSFSSKSRRLVEDVRELACGLGSARRMIRSYPSQYRDSSGEVHEMGPCHGVTLRFPADVLPFSLARKLERLPDCNSTMWRSQKVRLVEPIGIAEVQCIDVSGPTHLYITHDYIVTHNCYWITKKREAKGDEITGRVVSGTPTAYDISEMVLNREQAAALGLTPEQARERSTVQLSRRLDGIRAIADRLGKGVGDPQVQEAYLADARGGPYPHEHHHRLDTYQLIAHLQYGHGVEPADHVHRQHELLHTKEES